MSMQQAEAFRAEIERLKPLLMSRAPLTTTMPEALAQARGEVIYELLKRPPFPLDEAIDRVVRAVWDGFRIEAGEDELRDVIAAALRNDDEQEDGHGG